MHRLLVTLLLAPAPALAQEEPEEVTFAPDRPGFADSTATVPRGRAQVELGVRSSFEDDATLLNLPSILLRLGLTRFLEARVTAPDVQVDLPKGEGGTRVGAGDMSLGLKLAAALGESFSSSAVPFLTIPSGSKELSAGTVDGGIGFNFAFAIADLSVGANAILASEARLFYFGAGVSVGYQFTGAFGAYLETYIQYTHGDRVSPSGGGGLTYLVTPTFQIDLSGGAGFTSDAEGPYVLAGVALLL